MSNLWYQPLSSQQIIEIIEFHHNFDADGYVKWVCYDNVDLDDHCVMIHKDVWDLHLDKLFDENEYRIKRNGYHFLFDRYRERELYLYQDGEWEDDLGKNLK